MNNYGLETFHPVSQSVSLIMLEYEVLSSQSVSLIMLEYEVLSSVSQSVSLCWNMKCCTPGVVPEIASSRNKLKNGHF